MNRSRRHGSYEPIALELQRRIQHGELVPGYRLPSERELAAEFEVSRSVVHQAIRHLETIGLIQRLRNCRPTVAAANLSKSSHPKIGKDHIALWIHPKLEDMGAAMILKGIRNTLGNGGYKAVIGSPHSRNQESESTFLTSLIGSPSVAGAIVWHFGESDIVPAYQGLERTGMPVVFVDREPPEPIQADVVATNNRRGAKTAVRHLIALGHRRVAVVGNEERVSSVQERVDGYRSALEEAGIPLRPEYLTNVAPNLERSLRSEARRIAEILLALPEPPTAIFAVNDQVAMHLYEALTEMGLQVPQDVSLIGFDWFMRWLPNGGYLTTVCQQFEEIGQLAAQRLLERIAAPAPETVRTLLVESSLVLRGTTAPPREVLVS